MAFCTKCGATMSGAFCNQCGTPASAASPAAAVPPGVPPGPPPPYAAAPPYDASMQAMPPAPPPRKTHPIIWVLVALAGLFILFIIGVVGVSALVVHKARQAGLSTELMRRNPAAAMARMAAMANKDVEIVSEDDNSGTITVRNRKDGKLMTMSFDQAKNGFSIRADGDDGKTAEMHFGGGGDAKLPSWVPEYPGSKVQANFTASGTDSNGVGAGGNYTFTTSDSTAHVMSYYQDKTKDLGMKVKLNATTEQGGTVIAADESDRRTLTVIVGTSDGQTTVNVTYAEKR
jgi:hypothetical protein